MKNKINETVKEVLEDFQKRVEERKKFDMEWQLNMNFYMGNQFCSIGFGGLVEDMDRQYFFLLFMYG